MHFVGLFFFQFWEYLILKNFGRFSEFWFSKEHTTRSLIVITYYIRNYLILSTSKRGNECYILSAECARIYGVCFGLTGKAIVWGKQNNINILKNTFIIPTDAEHYTNHRMLKQF